MSDKNDGGPAFPSSNTPETGYFAEGMTLRDYFAAKAMQSFLAQRAFPWDIEIPATAYRIADAMLKARAE